MCSYIYSADKCLSKSKGDFLAPQQSNLTVLHLTSLHPLHPLHLYILRVGLTCAPSTSTRHTTVILHQRKKPHSILNQRRLVGHCKLPTVLLLPLLCCWSSKLTWMCLWWCCCCYWCASWGPPGTIHRRCTWGLRRSCCAAHPSRSTGLWGGIHVHATVTAPQRSSYHHTHGAHHWQRPLAPLRSVQFNSVYLVCSKFSSVHHWSGLYWVLSSFFNHHTQVHHCRWTAC